MELLTRRPRENRPTYQVGRRRLTRRFAIVAALLFGGVVIVGVAAFAYGSARSDRILPGVHVGNVDVGGMTRPDAARAVSEAEPRHASPLVVHAAGRTFRVDPQDLGVRVDAPRAVREAAAVSRRLGFFSRIYHRFVPLNVSIPLPFTTGEPEVQAFLDHAEGEVGRAPVDAEFESSSNGLRLVKQPARAGLELDRGRSAGLILHALEDRQPAVTLPVQHVPPRIDVPKTTITIDLSTNSLALWDGFRALQRYPVGTAQKGFRTPSGTWTIADKVKRPDWTNPDPNGWGSDLPRHIPPGPKSPLGLRALYLNAPGIAIHGTPEPWTVGSYVSHGCIRMKPQDVKRLFPAVPVGTPVVIYGAPPWGTKGGNGVPGV